MADNEEVNACFKNAVAFTGASPASAHIRRTLNELPLPHSQTIEIFNEVSDGRLTAKPPWCGVKLTCLPNFGVFFAASAATSHASQTAP